MVPLKDAIKFHGHLGPYLVLGLLAGELALKKLKAKKYFGLEVKVYGANIKPKSCLIDGLQLSTGATYGKGNIRKYAAKDIKIIIKDCGSGRPILITLDGKIKEALAALKGHNGSERFARALLKLDNRKIFITK